MTKRRAKGEGSVYRCKDGRVIGAYVDANGRKRYITSTTKTKAEMRAALRKLLADRDQGIAYDSENLTVGAYLVKWLEAIKGSVRDRTWERHEQVVRLHLEPTIGRVRLDRLNALQVQAVYGRKLEAGLSPRSVEIVHATLHKALRQAVGWTLIPRSEEALRADFEDNGLEVGSLEREERFLMRPEEDPLDGREEALGRLVEEKAKEGRTVWASFNWVRQVDLDTALEQQERLTEIVDVRQLVVKTAALDETVDEWSSAELRRAQSAHAATILATESGLSLSRATPMPPS